MNINLVIVLITCGVSFMAFRDHNFFDRLKFNAHAVKHYPNQWYRIFSYGLVHADFVHLAINMFVLYSFGDAVLYLFNIVFEGHAVLYYALLYIGGLAFSTLFDLRKYGDSPSYNAVGASGAVSAVIFASILIYPMGKISLLFIPIGIPSFIFGALYLIYSAYMGKKNIDNIGHNAHFWGAIYGMVLPIALKPALFGNFIDQITAYFS